MLTHRTDRQHIMKNSAVSLRVRALAMLALATALTAHSLQAASPDKHAKAYFAGGCFWCMEADFEKLEGVHEVVSGFTGGTLQNPTYDGDHSGHYETVEISYDPAAISYQQLLDVYWRSIDPFDAEGQFCDRGDSYRAAIFFSNATERNLASSSKAAVDALFAGQKVVTPVLAVTDFWPVKEYHQDYYKKRTMRYKYFRWRCGRDARLKDIWK